MLAGCSSIQGGGPLSALIANPPPASSSVSGGGAIGSHETASFTGIEQRGTGTFTSDRIGQSVINEVTSAPTKNGGEGVAINLLNAPLPQAAKTILGDILKVNYTIADKLSANITIQTSTPVQKAALIDIFDSALKVNGLVLVRSSGSYRIMADAQSSRASASLAGGERNGGPGVQVTVVPLRYVSPSEMRRIVEPVLTSAGVLIADDPRNLLVLAGTVGEMSDVRRLIDHFDVDWMRGMSIAFYPVKSSDPEALVSELETVMGLNKDGPMKGSVRIIPNRRLSSIMVISTRPAYLDTARGWIQRLDRVAESTEVQFFVYKARNRSASELASVVTKMISSRESGATSRVTRVTAESVEPASGAQGGAGAASQLAAGTASPGTQLAAQSTGGGGAGGGTDSQSGGNAPFSTDQQQRSSSSDEDGGRQSSDRSGASATKIVADEPNSSLLINATRKEYERIVRILERIDVLPTQVMIEALVAEVTLTDELKFGVKWAFEKGHNTAALSDVDGHAAVIQPNFPGFSYFYLAKSISAAVDALSSITKVKVVSAPSLTVLDNRKATLQVGDQVPIVTQSTTATQPISTGGTTPVAVGVASNQVQMKDTGIILGFSPHVSSSGRVVLDIEQEVSNATQTTTSGIDSPTIQQRRIKTTVVVADGQVVALGGLIRENDTVTKSQVPVLGDIPVLGTAFRQKSDKIDRTELVIFVRPMVQRDANAAAEITDEFIQRMDNTPMTSKNGRDVYDRDARRILR